MFFPDCRTLWLPKFIYAQSEFLLVSFRRRHLASFSSMRLMPLDVSEAGNRNDPSTDHVRSRCGDNGVFVYKPKVVTSESKLKQLEDLLKLISFVLCFFLIDHKLQKSTAFSNFKTKMGRPCFVIRKQHLGQPDSHLLSKSWPPLSGFDCNPGGDSALLVSGT